MEIEKLPGLEYIGHTACFYVPRSKMTTETRTICHDFFLANYDAYTVEDSDIQGYWRRHPNDPIFEDENVKYVVSFHGQHRIEAFVGFLRRLCSMIGEECIYLTMGYKSFLIWPGSDNG